MEPDTIHNEQKRKNRAISLFLACGLLSAVAVGAIVWQISTPEPQAGASDAGPLLPVLAEDASPTTSTTSMVTESQSALPEPARETDARLPKDSSSSGFMALQAPQSVGTVLDETGGITSQHGVQRPQATAGAAPQAAPANPAAPTTKVPAAPNTPAAPKPTQPDTPKPTPTQPVATPEEPTTTKPAPTEPTTPVETSEPTTPIDSPTEIIEEPEIPLVPSDPPRTGEPTTQPGSSDDSASAKETATRQQEPSSAKDGAQ